MSREEFPFRGCPSSVKEFSYETNRRVFINGVEHHIRWQSRCLLDSIIEIKVYTTEKQKQQTNETEQRPEVCYPDRGVDFTGVYTFQNWEMHAKFHCMRHLPFKKWDLKNWVGEKRKSEQLSGVTGVAREGLGRAGEGNTTIQARKQTN